MRIANAGDARLSLASCQQTVATACGRAVHKKEASLHLSPQKVNFRFFFFFPSRTLPLALNARQQGPGPASAAHHPSFLKPPLRCGPGRDAERLSQPGGGGEPLPLPTRLRRSSELLLALTALALYLQSLLDQRKFKLFLKALLRLPLARKSLSAGTEDGAGSIANPCGAGMCRDKTGMREPGSGRPGLSTRQPG